MEINFLTLSYIIASVTFIVGLKMLSHPETARRGNLVAAGGMTLVRHPDLTCFVGETFGAG